MVTGYLECITVLQQRDNARQLGEISLGKSDEIFVRRQIFSPTKNFPYKAFTRLIFLSNEYYQIIEIFRESDEIYLLFSHECSIQRPNFRLAVNLRGY